MGCDGWPRANDCRMKRTACPLNLTFSLREKEPNALRLAVRYLAEAVVAVSVWILRQVLLVLFFGVIELASVGNFSRYLAKSSRS
jgi:hypothetical protein